MTWLGSLPEVLACIAPASSSGRAMSAADWSFTLSAYETSFLNSSVSVRVGSTVGGYPVSSTHPWGHASAAEALEALVSAGLAPGDCFDRSAPRAWWCLVCGGSGSVPDAWREEQRECLCGPGVWDAPGAKPTVLELASWCCGPWLGGDAGLRSAVATAEGIAGEIEPGALVVWRVMDRHQLRSHYRRAARRHTSEELSLHAAFARAGGPSARWPLACPERAPRRPRSRSCAGPMLGDGVTFGPPPVTDEERVERIRSAWAPMGALAGLGVHLIRHDPWLRRMTLAAPSLADWSRSGFA